MESISVVVRKFPEHNEEFMQAWKDSWTEADTSAFTDLNETEYVYCYICREPLSAKEKASPDFKINEYCPYCIKK